MARVKALRRVFGKHKDARLMDAAKDPRRRALGVKVTNRDGKKLMAATVETADMDAAEKMAPALAATIGRKRVVVSTESRAACKDFKMKRISMAALNIFQKIEHPLKVNTTMTPGHESLAGHAGRRVPRTSFPGVPVGRRRPNRKHQKVQKHYGALLTG
ncbi:hypothetical protein HPB48_021791 [Haemaphysalis longicornis]|uniref:Uncharacterized protein n=1 Tax=Haemaphysalis longicornis TaxID=44386 RepID=A0A9J6GAJ1_HAELO|nr:hypothetical protein HPB48_021791 [Haemaphysalis longicornis]